MTSIRSDVYPNQTNLICNRSNSQVIFYNQFKNYKSQGEPNLLLSFNIWRGREREKGSEVSKTFYHLRYDILCPRSELGKLRDHHSITTLLSVHWWRKNLEYIPLLRDILCKKYSWYGFPMIGCEQYSCGDHCVRRIGDLRHFWEK